MYLVCTRGGAQAQLYLPEVVFPSTNTPQATITPNSTTYNASTAWVWEDRGGRGIAE